jgi:hypothetical protein
VLAKRLARAARRLPPTVEQLRLSLSIAVLRNSPRATALVILLAACGHEVRPALVPIPLPLPAEVETTLWLIGDAGDPHDGGEPVLQALGEALHQDPGHSLVVFLGDNVYPRGLPDSGSPNRAEAERRLDAQIDVVVNSGARGIFIPGNHDWDRFGPDGWNAIRRQGEHIAERGQGRVELQPQAGCPGPVIRNQGERLRLVLLDTQWWLQAGAKPHDAASGCPTYAEVAMGNALGEAIQAGPGRHVVVLGHHPLRSGGEHGGYFGWQDHLFPLRNAAPWLWIPLPVVGSIYPLARSHGLSSQDLSGHANLIMQHAFAEAFAARPPLIYGSGHDHGLQVLDQGPARYLLVSGAGIYHHEGPVHGIDGTLYARRAAGFMRLDFLTDGRVRLGVIEVDERGRATEAFDRWLADSTGESFAASGR